MMTTRLILTVLCVGILGCTSAAASAESGKPLPEREKYLLLDSRVVAETDNARLAVGTVKKHPQNPVMAKEHPWEHNFNNMYPNIIYDQDDKLYKLWYPTSLKPGRLRAAGLAEVADDDPDSRIKRATPPTGYADELAKKLDIDEGRISLKVGGRECICYAVSKDGLEWEKPLMNFFTYEGKPTHIVAEDNLGVGVFKDPGDPDPRRRYKMLTMPGLTVAFSPDGKHWSKYIRAAIPSNPQADCHNNAMWDPILKKYVCITRGWPGGQRVALRTESEDFINWTKPVEVLRDRRDSHQLYDMCIFRHAGVYLAQLDLLDTKEFVHVSLAWSPDGVKWEHIDPETPLIPRGKKEDSYDYGCVYCADDPIICDDEIRLYYCGSIRDHSWRDSTLCLATLRPDGWAGYVPKDPSSPAVVITEPVKCNGKTLRVTADVEKGGSVKASLLDQDGKELIAGKTITTNVTAAPGADVAKLQGQAVRVKFEIDKAKVYSLAFGE